MTEALTAAGIKTALLTVSNIGVVYDYQRYADQWDDFLSLFQTTIGSTPQIRGWQIGLNSVQLLPPPFEDSTAHPCHTFRYDWAITGFMSVDDASESEKTARALAVAVVDKLRKTRENVTATAVNTGIPQITSIGYAVFGGVLVHNIQISWTTEEIQ